MTLRPYKFQIVPIVQQIEGGRVIAEQSLFNPDGSPIVVYGMEGLEEWVGQFEMRLVASEGASLNARIASEAPRP